MTVDLFLTLFVNGIPVATCELKSEFKQSIDNAKVQYMKDRLPKDKKTHKSEPLLTLSGALVHFAVSQYNGNDHKLKGQKYLFLPFDQGTSEGGKGERYPRRWQLCDILSLNEIFQKIICCLSLGDIFILKSKMLKI